MFLQTCAFACNHMVENAEFSYKIKNFFGGVNLRTPSYTYNFIEGLYANVRHCLQHCSFSFFFFFC